MVVVVVKTISFLVENWWGCLGAEGVVMMVGVKQW